MILNLQQLTDNQKSLVIQRLTAFWAFVESGIGGLMHTLKIPFTGLFVGGFAIVTITLIAQLSQNNKAIIFKALSIVLIVKFTISPNTPFPAYIAVSFQAFIAYIFYSLLSINFLSVALVSCISMLESAIQKLLLLTLFFGKSFWIAIDQLLLFITKQFNYVNSNGLYWVIILYIGVYILGGLMFTIVSMKLLNLLKTSIEYNYFNIELIKQPDTAKRKAKSRMYFLFLFMIIISALLFVFSSESKWYDIAKFLCYSTTIIVFWFTFILPFITKILIKYLNRKQSFYQNEINEVLLFLPYLKSLFILALKQQKGIRGFKKWNAFLKLYFVYIITFSYKKQSQIVE